ncbi:MAG: HigA family addiction module antitoxin [Pyrinomonadaceae bacterium]
MPIKRNRRPTHPGAILREDTLPEINLSADELADALGISRQNLKEILDENAPVTADIAHRLGRAFGMSPDIWLRMQQAVDLYDTQAENEAVYSKIERIAA